MPIVVPPAPTDTATVRGIIQTPGGVAAVNVPVYVRLVASRSREAGGFVGDSDIEVLGVEATRTDSTGLWSLTLVANAEITPPGTVYEVSEQPKGRPAHRYYISVPATAGPHWVGDLTTTLPTVAVLP